MNRNRDETSSARRWEMLIVLEYTTAMHPSSRYFERSVGLLLNHVFAESYLLREYTIESSYITTLKLCACPCMPTQHAQMNLCSLCVNSKENPLMTTNGGIPQLWFAVLCPYPTYVPKKKTPGSPQSSYSMPSNARVLKIHIDSRLVTKERGRFQRLIPL